MKKTKTLFVQFDESLPAWQIPAFRGALIEKVGREHALFHQHRNEEAYSYIYRYPLIQYKSIQYKPSLLCLDEGVDEMHKLFGQRNWNIRINGELYHLKIHKLELNNVTLNVWDRPFRYGIYNWVALNGDNFRRYCSIDRLSERIKLLERLLVGNILSFAKGISWQIEQTVIVQIQQLKGERIVRFKGVPLVAFDVEFNCNVFLPNYLGLGKSASHGFGIIRQLRV